MNYKLINCEQLLKKITKKDELFNGVYCIDPYQNCEFGCSYCDSSFDKTIYIKNNSDKILESELKKTKKGTIIIGSVHDPYQKAEEKYKITKKILEVIKKCDFPCHILTKSGLILRDLKILKSLDCRITISILSINETISNIFEKNVISPKRRLQILKILKNNNITSGIALIPILPYIIDDELEDILKTAKNHNADYLVYKHLELKGEQKIYFFNLLKKQYPDLIKKYKNIYEGKIKPDNIFTENYDLKIKNLKTKYKLDNKTV